MGYFLNSSNVFVFPCAGRSAKYDLAAKIMSENNLTNIIRTITDKKSFVINDNVQNLEFVINGYYFKLTNYNLTGDVFAQLNLLDGTLVGDGTDEGTDEGTEYFKGLSLTNDKPSEGEYLTLCINGKVPTSSKVKFNRDSLDLQTIDAGELV